MPNPNNPDEAECRLCFDTGVVPGTDRLCPACNGIQVSGNLVFRGATTGRITTGRPNVQEIADPNPLLDSVIKSISMSMERERWRFNPIYQEMGAWAQFDYSGDVNDASVPTSFFERLTRCYELAAHGLILNGDRVTVPDNFPMPWRLIHGTYSHPDSRDHPIQHAWLEMSDNSIWEPISSLLYLPKPFMDFTQARVDRSYTKREAGLNMVRSGHYGRWH